MTLARLQIRVLGPLEVTRDGAVVRMPRSKKTRGLLAYLAITGRPHLRGRLCSLLWDVADDPRGALRWSLSKIRPLVNGEEHTRLLADRKSVELDLDAACVDLAVAQREVGRDIGAVSTERLEELATMFGGELLEGLELGDFHEFTAWCAAERESARSLHLRILGALTDRLEDAPSLAADHAREHARLDPFDEDVRARLITLLGRAGRQNEAEAQYRSGTRLLEEAGIKPTGSLRAAWRERSRGSTTVSEAAPTAPVEAVRPSAPVEDRDVLIGRVTERARLLSMLDDVAQGPSPSVCLLTGEPGIGKTRLLAELTSEAEARGATVLRGAAYEAETGRPYGPWIDALRGLGSGTITGDIAAALTPLLPELGESDDRAHSRDRLFGAMVDLVAANANDAPVLIVFDDVHWCDDATAELLHYVVRMSGQRPVLVVLSAREGELVDCEPMMRAVRSFRRDRLLRELALPPLDARYTAELVHIYDEKIDAAAVFAQCGGNPLLATELARSGAELDGRVPHTLNELVRDRLARLTPDAGDLLRWAAVLGASFDVARLERLVSLDLDGLVKALSSLERHALLSSSSAPGSYAFPHDLLRRVVYSEMSEPRRRLMHHTVARVLDESDDAGRLAVDVAHHAGLGGDAAMAARACVRAGAQCLRVFANAEAHAHAKRGLHYAESLAEPERVKLRLELTEVSVGARRPADRDDVARHVEALAEEALDAGCREHARLGFSLVSFLRWEDGAVTDARRLMLRAEQASRGADERDRVKGMAEAARCLTLLERDLGHAEALLLEARAVSERAGIDLFAVPDGVGLLRLHRGELDEAAELFARARLCARSNGDRLMEFAALEHLLTVELVRENRPAAALLAQELAAIGEKVREGSEAPFSLAMLALCRYADGADGARAELEAALAALRNVDAKQRLAFVLIWAGLVELERGDPVRAASCATEALRLARLLERVSDIGMALTILVRAANEGAEAGETNRHLGELTDLRGYASHVGAAIEGVAGASA